MRRLATDRVASRIAGIGLILAIHIEADPCFPSFNAPTGFGNIDGTLTTSCPCAVEFLAIDTDGNYIAAFQQSSRLKMAKYNAGGKIKKTGRYVNPGYSVPTNAAELVELYASAVDVTNGHNFKPGVNFDACRDRTLSPTSTPTQPAPSHTLAPTSTPTQPAPSHTLAPTSSPTSTPTFTLTSTPTSTPTSTLTVPTSSPTDSPTSSLASTPTLSPTSTPTSTPTSSPVPTDSPTFAPSYAPSFLPTPLPPGETHAPTVAPTALPTELPSASPSFAPSEAPTPMPSALPSMPTETPTIHPTSAPTSLPTMSGSGRFSLVGSITLDMSNAANVQLLDADLEEQDSPALLSLRAAIAETVPGANTSMVRILNITATRRLAREEPLQGLLRRLAATVRVVVKFEIVFPPETSPDEIAKAGPIFASSCSAGFAETLNLSFAGEGAEANGPIQGVSCDMPVTRFLEDGESMQSIDDTTIGRLWTVLVSVISVLVFACLFLSAFCWRHSRKALVKKRRASEMSGVSLAFVLQNFKDELRVRMAKVEWRLNPHDNRAYTKESFWQFYRDAAEDVWEKAAITDIPLDPNFKQMAPVVAYGNLAFGFEKRCPRDGKIHCSIVDSIEGDKSSKSATHFVSWAWDYTLTTVFDAFESLKVTRMRQTGEWDPGALYIWWCFYCNNQFRLLMASEKQEFDSLAIVFEDRLRSVGNMLVIMDRLTDSTYVSRLWCIFEIFVANKAGIPLTIMMPDAELRTHADTTDLNALQDKTIIHAELAKATVLEDEEGIKGLIRRTHGFEFINRRVQHALVTALVDCVMDARAASMDERAASQDSLLEPIADGETICLQEEEATSWL